MLKNAVFEGGFFKPCQYQFLNAVNDEEKSKFSTLNKIDKVKFVYNFPAVRSFTIHTVFNIKDLRAAEELKEQGNSEFVKGNFQNSRELYIRSIMTIPLTEGNMHILAVTTANYSAALYHLKRYHETVSVVEYVLNLPYPKELEYKVMDRMARSYEATNQYERAKNAFQETLKAIEYGNISATKKKGMKCEIEKIIRRLDGARLTDNSSEKSPSENLLGGRSDHYPSLSSFVTIKQSSEMGRYAEAVKKIKTGEVILTEDAHCAVLLAERRETNCFHCFKRFSCPVPCPNCSAILFCSSTCKEVALQSHHKVECPILQTLWDSGASITCLMALRIISQKGLKYFLELKDTLTKFQMKNGNKYNNFGYETVYNLVTHTDQRSVVDMLLRTNMAVLLLRCLKMANYFDNPADAPEGKSGLSENEAFIGSLLLHNLELLQFNAHEISEIHTKKDRSTKSIFLGGGLYPTLALFNHSCNPSIVRYFHGTSVVVRAVRTLQDGELVSENYGPNFIQVPKEERQNLLKEQYWFDCKCLPCMENWPTFSEMDPNIMRFRCNSGRNCNSVVCIPTSIENCFIQCKECKGHTNILKGLKELQGIDGMNLQAQQFAKSNNIGLALSEYVKVLDLLAATLAPPFKDYCICQESIRNLLMHFGNRYDW